MTLENPCGPLEPVPVACPAFTESLAEITHNDQRYTRQPMPCSACGAAIYKKYRTRKMFHAIAFREERAVDPPKERVPEPAPAPEKAPEKVPPKKHKTRKHAKNSPSRLGNIEICPLHRKEQKKALHPVTAAGTRIHEAFESGDDIELDDEELALANYCRAYRDHVLGDHADWDIEQELKLETHESTCGGFADLVAISRVGPGIAHLIDPKTGFNRQSDAEVNLQMWAYTVGIFLKYPVEEVHVHLIYPRYHEVSVATFTRADLPRLKLRISTVIERATMAQKQAKGGAKTEPRIQANFEINNCTYCGNKAGCPVLWGKALQLAPTPALMLELPEVLNPEQIVAPDQMGTALRLAQFVGEWAKEVKAWVQANSLDAGTTPDGYGWRDHTAKGKSTNPIGLSELARAFGISDEHFLDACNVSVAQLSKAAAAVAPRGQKGKTEIEFKDESILKGLYVKGNTTQVLQRLNAPTEE